MLNYQFLLLLQCIFILTKFFDSAIEGRTIMWSLTVLIIDMTCITMVIFDVAF